MPDLVGDMGDPALAHELVEAMDGLTFKLVDGGLQIVKKPTP